MQTQTLNPFQFLPAKSRRNSFAPSDYSGLSADWNAAGTLNVARANNGAIPATFDLVGHVADASGNARHLVAADDTTPDSSRPTYIADFQGMGFPAIYLSGSTIRLCSSTSITDAPPAAAIGSVFGGTNPSFTMFLLCWNRIESGDPCMWGMCDASATGISAPAGTRNIYTRLMQDVTTAGRPVVRHGSRDNAATGVSSDSSIGWGGSPWKVISVRWNGTTARETFQNGNQTNNPTPTSGTWTFTAADWFTINGMFANGATNIINGGAMAFNRCLVYNTALSDGQHQQVVKYLLGIIGMDTNIVTPRTTWWFGDSHTVGNTGTAVQATNNVATCAHRFVQQGPFVNVAKMAIRAISGRQLNEAGQPDIVEQYYIDDDGILSGDTVVFAGTGSNDVAGNASIVDNASAETQVDATVLASGANTLKGIIDNAFTTKLAAVFVMSATSRESGSASWSAAKAHAMAYYSTGLNTYVDTLNGNNYDWYTATKASGTEYLDTSFDSPLGDGIHLSNAAHALASTWLATEILGHAPG